MTAAGLPSLDNASPSGLALHNGNMLCLCLALGMLDCSGWLLGRGGKCHTRFWKANQMRTMYVPGSETQIHSDYIIGHHHTMLEINSRKVLDYIKMSKTSTESIT
jgi:hypothetical protein